MLSDICYPLVPRYRISRSLFDATDASNQYSECLALYPMFIMRAIHAFPLVVTAEKCYRCWRQREINKTTCVCEKGHHVTGR